MWLIFRICFGWIHIFLFKLTEQRCYFYSLDSFLSTSFKAKICLLLLDFPKATNQKVKTKQKQNEEV